MQFKKRSWMRRSCLLAMMPAMVGAWARAQVAAPPVGAAPPAAQAPAPETSRWPFSVDTPDGGQIVMYQPQVEKLDGNTLTARAAVSVQKNAQQEPVFGVIWMESRVSIDRSARTVQILDTNITRSRFPEQEPAEERALGEALKQRLVDEKKLLSLDQLLKMLEVVNKEQANSQQLQTAPPKVIFRDHPTVKVQYDGTPKLVQVDKSPLLRAVNTPFFVVLEPADKTYYLKGGGRWFGATDPMGPFKPTDKVPKEAVDLADSDGYKDPEDKTAASQAPNIEIITATDPTEVVWTDGPKQMSTIAGTGLLYVANTDSDLFLDISTQRMFVLISGRWYTAPNENGPWEFVASDKLPPDFAKIPPDGEKGNVLAQVAGTTAAQDAVADTYVPQTAAVDRAKVEAPSVTYDGDPQFAVAEGTNCSYAVNTSYSVVMVNHRYYCCNQAVWYECGAPVGPWTVCVRVPPDIYTLPPSCPIYSCRYCYVYGYTPDVVYVGYTPGYLGCYAWGGSVVYGTGYYYRPYIGRNVYYARPWTYGYSARYAPYSGSWGFGIGFAYGGGAAWIGIDERRPIPGGHWFGYGGYRPAYVRNDVRIMNGRNVTINQYNVNVERNRLNESRNIYVRRTDVRKEDMGRATPAGNPAVRGGGSVRRPPAGDVYAGPNGNVFRKTDAGWESRKDGKWVGDNGNRAASPPRAEAPDRAGRPVQAAPLPRAESPAEGERRENRQPPAEAREPARATPGREAPVSRDRSLDDEARARSEGQNRQRNSPRDEPAPRPAPTNPGNNRNANDGGGGGGGSRGGGGGGGGGGDRGGGKGR